ncbi:MAG: sn-glycerol-1-phosphate dehydrogenase [Clostridiales bacterium]|nr:sn-glycerol-1-phosphate dehydrogenase [Clostridiales bacterium]
MNDQNSTKEYSLEALLACDGFDDGCGRIHSSGVKDIVIGSGTIERLPDCIRRLGGTKPFLVADENTWKAAGERINVLLEKSGFKPSKYVFNNPNLEPDEQAVGSAVMHYDYSCDIIIGIGSGVINDISKIIAAMTGNEYIIAATAPSMDGFASATSSMSRDGLKVSLPSKCASIVIGDTDILAAAPAEMLASGVGDMIAKYISLCEWKLANIIVGEYYCPNIAAIVRSALDEVVSHADGLVKREPEAVESVMRGMVLAGIAMNYAGLSRPASGVEHYFSHVWDMRGLEFGTPVSLHGIQCGVATLLSLKVYEQIAKIAPNKEKALAYAKNFDYAEWSDELRSFLGKGAETMIAAEAKDGKYDVTKHAARLDSIISHWDEIIAEVKALPKIEDVESVLKTIGAPTTPAELGQSPEVVQMSFLAAKDIRDKYVAPRLLWDIGELDSVEI